MRSGQRLAPFRSLFRGAGPDSSLRFQARGRVSARAGSVCKDCKDIWALRVPLQMEKRVRELALFHLGIDSKLPGGDLVGLKVRDTCHGDQVASRAEGDPMPVQIQGAQFEPMQRKEQADGSSG